MPQMQVRIIPFRRLTAARGQSLLVLPISNGCVSDALGPDVRFSSPSSSIFRFLEGVSHGLGSPLHQQTACISKRDGSASVQPQSTDPKHLRTDRADRPFRFAPDGPIRATTRAASAVCLEICFTFTQLGGLSAVHLHIQGSQRQVEEAQSGSQGVC